MLATATQQSGKNDFDKRNVRKAKSTPMDNKVSQPLAGWVLLVHVDHPGDVLEYDKSVGRVNCYCMSQNGTNEKKKKRTRK